MHQCDLRTWLPSNTNESTAASTTKIFQRALDECAAHAQTHNAKVRKGTRAGPWLRAQLIVPSDAHHTVGSLVLPSDNFTFTVDGFIGGAAALL